MPLYTYKCPDCNGVAEVLQSYDEMLKFRERMRCSRCEGRMAFQFPHPHLVTDATFVANWGDGFEGRPSQRKAAYAKARAAGVEPSGKTYCPELATEFHDPKAWVPHGEARHYVKQRCIALGRSCNWSPMKGLVNVKGPTSGEDPLEKPYRPAPDIVEEEVEAIVERDYEGHIPANKRADLVEATAERLSGNNR